MDVVAILPAAGAATRLRGAFKELLPIALEPVDGGLVPVPALVHALRTCAHAGVPEAVVVIAPGKLELARLVGDGEELGVRVAWVVQPRPDGLTDAIVRALPWVGARRAVVVLPDTVFTPPHALADVLALGGDVGIGVFPTDRPHELGPVVLDGDRVVSVLEKPSGPTPRNTWGIMTFGPSFGSWLTERVRQDPALGAMSLGPHVDAAVRDGLDVRAVAFPDGSFRDLGTPRGLADWILPAAPGSVE